jgi:NitT/TauT family transport system substrate-binding protein
MSGKAGGLLIGLDGVPDLEAKGFKAHTLMYADLGVNTPVSSVATTTTTISEKPDLVRRFVAVTQRAWDEAVKHPDAVVEACMAAKPTGSREAFRKQLDVAIASLASANTTGKPLGWGSEKDWQKAIDIQKEYRKVKTDQPPAAFYTAEFLPK